MPRGRSPHKRTEWCERLQRFVGSELSLTEFCQREGVSPSSFHRWRKELDSSPNSQALHSLTRASFVPVQVATSHCVEVNFPNGVRLALPVSDPELIRISIDTIAQAETRRGGV